MSTSATTPIMTAETETIPEIPEDIWIVAQDVAHDVFEADCTLMETGDNPVNTALVIAHAILAERERIAGQIMACAEIYGNSAGLRNAGAASALRQLAFDLGATPSFWSGVSVAYLVVALMTGAAVSRAIPALNGLGAAYAGATWPMAMFCAATQLDCTPLPPAGSPLANAFFTFKDPEQ